MKHEELMQQDVEFHQEFVARQQKLEKTAISLRRAYEFFRQGWRERAYSGAGYKYRLPVSQQSMSLWLGLAKRCIELDLEPVPYLQFIFDHLTQGYAPEPKQIFADKLVASYLSADMVDRELQLGLEAQQSAARGFYSAAKRLGLKGEEAWKWVLDSSSAPISALYRCCCAARLGMDYDKFLPAAVRQYIGNKKAYDRCWKSIIPNVIRVEAAKLSKHLEGSDAI